ncbi:hypothetical protein ETD86_01725 [Nonomuraea turkmeniaca]|uniref:Uncharacterized protein n=1 Tax=Nonomuraea turkmeniaca TaxID=103838 RepID=A0A5S4FXD4_9ACTN|nr:hypothetical protein [Nonomuraea turkmeniaca]TMR25332.1 hypothetical protein ETD86_01725 [Nonomuraea turkmeniaca]
MTGRHQTPTSSKSTITTRTGRGKRRHVRLSVTQIIGGALAALTAAIAASYLGMAGTVIGAALMSVATMVGTDIYTHYLRRTGDKVRQHTTTSWRKRPAQSEAATPPVTLPHPPRGRLGWLRVGAAAALVFTISFGGILIYQILAGQTVADQVNGKTLRKAEPGRRHGPKERRAEPALRQPRSRSASPAPAGAGSPAPSPTPSSIRGQVTATPAPSGTVSVTPAPYSPPATLGSPPATPSTPSPSEDLSRESAPASPAPAPALR